MQLLRLVRNQVRVGAPLPWGVRDDAGKLLLARGTVVPNEQLMEALLTRGAYVDPVEVQQSRGEAMAANRAGSLVDLWAKLYGRVDLLLRAGETDPKFVAKVTDVAEQLHALIDSDADVGIFLMMQPGQERPYGIEHHVHAALVADLVARRLGWTVAERLALTQAALTMNLAIHDVQTRLAHQSAPLNPMQKATIRSHPEKTVARLRAAGVDDAIWLAAVAQHHEKPDGQGYPTGTTDVAPAANLLRHADAYAAMLRPRAHRPALAPHEAARALFADNPGSPVAAEVLKEFGAYPPGCNVKLACGELAVVLRRGAQPTAPVVMALTNRSGQALGMPVRRDTATAEFHVVGIVPEQAVRVRIPPERLYGLKTA